MKQVIPTRFAKDRTEGPTGLDVNALVFSAFTRDKAARFIEQGRVKRVDGQKDLWQVTGDHGAYRVRYDKNFEETHRVGFLVCTCPLSEHHAGLIGYCSHALAVLATVLDVHPFQIGATE